MKFVIFNLLPLQNLLSLITSLDILAKGTEDETDYSDTELLVNNLEDFSNIVEEENPDACSRSPTKLVFKDLSKDLDKKADEA